MMMVVVSLFQLNILTFPHNLVFCHISLWAIMYMNNLYLLKVKQQR